MASEASDAQFMVSGDGNRESHYRSHAVGVTLAHMLGRSLHRQTELAPLRKALVRFKDKVEKAYPGLFAFFDESSLHVTLRALF